MTEVNLYFYVEDLALTAAQRSTIIDQLQKIGRRDGDTNPKNRNHWRVRPDGKGAIFEAWWDEDMLTAIAIRNRLAVIFGVAQTSITYTTANTTYGPVATYTHSATPGTPRFRMGVFGGASATYEQSKAAVLQYLKDNASVWE